MFKGLENLASLPGLMKQAQEMTGKMQEMTKGLAAMRVVGSSGAGMVEVEASGTGEVVAVRIDPGLIEKQDRELLEDLLPGAINDAQRKAKELYASQMQELTGGMNIPGLSDMLGQIGDGPR